MIITPEKWIAEVENLETKYCKEIRAVDPTMAVLNLKDSYPNAYNVIKGFLSRFENPQILEIGTGYGFCLTYLRKLGLNAVGVEPGNSAGFAGRYNQAIALMKANGLTEPESILFPATGEALPFADNSFDIVYSIDVLEHVKDIKQCLLETHRVVKPGGVVIMLTPNYNSFKEHHYNIFWLPHLLKSKLLARLYVRFLFGRKDWFIDEMNFVTPSFFRSLASETKQLNEMKMFLLIDTNIPILGNFFNRIANKHYRLLNEPPSRRCNFMRTLTGLALRLGEFLGMAAVCRVVWDPAKPLL